jgi:MFS family permease
MSTANHEVEPRDLWIAYAGLAAVGYITYGLGAAGPHLRSHLSLSNVEIGLHSSALALGLASAGMLVADLGRRFGERMVRSIAIGLLAIALILLAVAPSVEVTLTAGAIIGFGAGALLGYANVTLGSAGGGLARLRLARGHIGAMIAALVVPLALAASASAGPGWWLGLLPAAVLLGAIAFALRAGPLLSTTADVSARRRLPRKFWLAWLFLAAAIGVEFSIVFWGATLVQLRSGLTIPAATAVGALFFAGMLVGRLGLAIGLGAGHPTRRVIAAGLALTAIGTGLAWVSTTDVLSALALFIAGLGVSVLYPLGAAAALAAAPAQAAVAGNRLTLASGLAILVAPVVLGTVADATGIVAAWGLVLGLVGIALGLVLTLPDEAAVGPSGK